VAIIVVIVIIVIVYIMVTKKTTGNAKRAIDELFPRAIEDTLHQNEARYIKLFRGQTARPNARSWKTTNLNKRRIVPNIGQNGADMIH
jgi:hypothetical protein